MRFKIFISSVQSEFAKERKALASFVRSDLLLKTFFEVFLFEEVEACDRTAQAVYLDEVRKCDLYLGLFGRTYGNADATGVSPTEREFDLATELGKQRLAFILKSDKDRDKREMRLISKVESEVVRNAFTNLKELKKLVYAALFGYLKGTGKIQVSDWDASFDTGEHLDALDERKLVDFLALVRRKKKVRLPEKMTPRLMLEKLKLVDDRDCVANAGVLLFAQEPQRWFVSSEVKCAQFYGTKVVKPMPNYRILEGDALELIEGALAFVLSRIDLWTGDRTVSGTAAVNTELELPEDAIKEAIVNAVVHRDYTSNGSVQVMLFRDRLEITNPARLPRGWSIARFSEEHTSEPPNRVLAKPMQWAGYVEKAGTGTTDIIEKCVACGLRKPEYAFDGNTVKLTIWRTGSATSSNGGVSGGVWRSGQDGCPHDTPHDAPHVTPYDKITDGQRRLLQILLQADACGPAALRDALKIKDVSDFRERYLHPLMGVGLIEQTLPERKRSRLQRYRLTTEGLAFVKSDLASKREDK